MTTDNRTNEMIVAEAMVDAGSPLMPSRVEEAVVEALRAAGRLAGEPTETQVEAALAAHEAHKGAWVDEFREMVCPECGWCYMTEHERRPDNKPSNEVVYARVDAHRMRAALVAAAGAAPVQPPSTVDEIAKVIRSAKAVQVISEDGSVGPGYASSHDIARAVVEAIGGERRG